MTLSGSVLFPTRKSTLLPTAQNGLADVAAALRNDQRSITIVGPHRRVGADSMNQQLSQSAPRRAHDT